MITPKLSYLGQPQILFIQFTPMLEMFTAKGEKKATQGKDLVNSNNPGPPPPPGVPSAGEDLGPVIVTGDMDTAEK